VSLAFLTPDAAPSRQLRARSPMERSAVAAGARLAQLEGWNAPNAFSEPATEWGRLTRTVGFVDRSRLTKLEIQADPLELARILARASESLASDRSSRAHADDETPVGALALEQGLAAYSTGTWWCPVTPGRVLVLGEPRNAVMLREAVAQAAEHARGTVTVLDVTCGLAALSLIGPRARELLARFCAIDARPALAPPGAFRPGSVARTPGYLLVEADDRLMVLVGWALGEYLWEIVADAATPLGGGPVGAEALAHHLERDDA
jgi:heterotetrameric sarcosine oxidase gamma subunit